MNLIRIIDLPPARIPELVPLAREFYDAGDLPGDLDPAVFCDTWAYFLFHGVGILLAAECEGQIVGSIGGVLVPDPRDGRLVSNEHHWFVAKDWRRSSAGARLLRTFEAEALRRGAERITMAHLANELGEKLAPIFLANGYRPVEVHYSRDLVQHSALGHVQVTDSLLEAPQEFLARARRLEFGTHEYAGHEYHGVALSDDHFDAQIKGAIRSRMNIDPQIRLSFFRIARKGNDEPTAYIHADNAVPAAYAGVLYLTPDNLAHGGTAFWRHRELNWGRLPDFVPTELADRLNADGRDELAWERNGLVRMKFNRFVTYPTNAFHSRYPLEGFGSDADDARLTYVCFFDLED